MFSTPPIRTSKPPSEVEPVVFTIGRQAAEESECSDSEDERDPVYCSDLAKVMQAFDTFSCTPPASPRSGAPLSSDSRLSNAFSSPARRSPNRRARHYRNLSPVVSDLDESTKKARTFSPCLTPRFNVTEEDSSMRRSVKRSHDGAPSRAP